MRVEDQPVYDSNLLHPIDFAALAGLDDAGHPPRILLLYGSLIHKVIRVHRRKRGREYCGLWVVRQNYLILHICLFLMQSLTATPRCKNCENSRSGVKVWSGPAPSGMVP